MHTPELMRTDFLPYMVTFVCVRVLIVSKVFKMEEVKKWLNGLSLSVYYEGFIDNGYDDLDAIRLGSVGRGVVVYCLTL